MGYIVLASAWLMNLQLQSGVVQGLAVKGIPKTAGMMALKQDCSKVGQPLRAKHPATHSHLNLSRM